ncbi:hypothetical protein RHGRI_037556 [Rhododendron griersonianum]|uniref:XMAP215/Dis1/CLASP TOG domain-containing protein n=1 Tax=Rhododendron griersonianum TaxID=479676 RepID=A0AAV6HSL0_9ERIC|nr:hypothetical protein RHGRI_037556 [Rhododendron griersonianum]
MMSEDERLLKEARKLPWEDRLTHKNWKVRNKANTDLASVCESIARLRAFGELGFLFFSSNLVTDGFLLSFHRSMYISKNYGV